MTENPSQASARKGAVWEGCALGKVLIEISGPVATLTLNRPEAFNAVDLELGEDLLAAVSQVHADPTVRAVIITGAGKAFCSGGDLRYFQSQPEPRRDAFAVLTQRLHRLILDIRQMPKPVVAAINGAAGGAGVSLAMACDLRLAADTARFKQAYTSVGLTPDGGWSLLVARQIGYARAAEMVLLDPVLDAQQALSMGLVNRVVAVENLAQEAAHVAARLAAGPTEALARAKALLSRSLLSGLEEQLELEREGIMAASETQDFAEGLEAFFSKRAPQFKGR